MPAKLWADFERLTASDLNTYLAQQVAAIFANAAARDAAIPAPIDGQPAYLTDLRALTVWTGSAWKTVGIAGGTVAGLTETAPQTALNSGALTLIALSIVQEDTHGFALGSSKLTVPPGLGGLYALHGAVVWNSPGATATGYRIIMIRKNGATVILQHATPGIPNTQLPDAVAGTKRLIAGDYLELLAQHSQGSALAIVNNAGEYGPLLQLQRIAD